MRLSGFSLWGLTVKGVMQIRDAGPDDKPALIRFMGLLQDVERRLHPSRRPGGDIAASHLGYLENVVREQEGRLLIATIDGTPAGFLVCYVEEFEDYLHQADKIVGWISDIYVDESCRGRGVSTALLKVAEQHFSECGLTKVLISFLANNELARTAYDQAGFRPYELIYEKPVTLTE